MHDDFINGGEFLNKSMGYKIVEDTETGDVHWNDPKWEKVHLIIRKADRDRPWRMPIIIGQASDKAVRMVQEVQAHNDALKEKKAKEVTDGTKKHLHEWIKKIKSQGIL